MHPQRKQRLLLVLFIVTFASVAVGLMLFALRENINLFYPPSAIVNGEAPTDALIRAGGCVVPGRVERSKTNLDVSFWITDGAAELQVLYSGILPDLFAEGEAVVVNGRVNERRIFEASQVLAKHDENYTPAEVSDAVAGAAEAAEKGEGHAATCDAINFAGEAGQ